MVILRTMIIYLFVCKKKAENMICIIIKIMVTYIYDIDTLYFKTCNTHN